MGQKKAKEKRAQAVDPGITIQVDQALQMQFSKVGQLSFQIDIMTQQMTALENENNALKAKIKKLKKKK